MMKHIHAAARSSWRHKRRSAASVLGLLVAAYAVVFTTVSCASSPTDKSVALADGRTLAYRIVHEEVGGQRVLLVHGAPADASSWNKLVKRAGSSFDGLEVIAPDRLGYGNSSSGAETSLEAHARSLEPLITPGTILVGHSYGGPVVLRTAAEYPDRVAGVVLIAGACDPDMNDSVWFRKTVDGVSALVPEPWEVSNLELLALTAENNEMRSLVSRVTCPVTVIHGTWDPVCPHDGTVNYLKGALVNAADVRVVSLERASHNLHLSKPTLVAEEIERLAR